MELYSARERNTFESVLVMWMKMEPIMESEVRRKEKIKYRILLHIYGTDEPVCRAAVETQRTDVWTLGIGRRGWD